MKTIVLLTFLSLVGCVTAGQDTGADASVDVELSAEDPFVPNDWCRVEYACDGHIVINNKWVVASDALAWTIYDCEQHRIADGCETWSCGHECR